MRTFVDKCWQDDAVDPDGKSRTLPIINEDGQEFENKDEGG